MTALDRSAAAHARATAGKIRQAMKDYWAAVGLVSLAYQQRHWEALGYESWDSYCHGEFGPERLGLPSEHSQKTLDVFRATGMSVRAIASATGVPKSSIGDALSQLSEAGQLEQPAQVIGVDGKARPATQTPARRDLEPNPPGPAVATPGEPAEPEGVAVSETDAAVISSTELEGVAPEAEGTSGAASSTEPPAGPRDLVAESPSPDRPGLAEQTELARWQAGFLAQVHAVHKVLRYPVADVVAMADDECLSELRRVVQLATRYLDDIDTLARAELPANVTPIRRAQ